MILMMSWRYRRGALALYVDHGNFIGTLHIRMNSVYYADIFVKDPCLKLERTMHHPSL